jgi:hypothetical protein
MVRKLITLTIVTLGLFGATHHANAGAPFPHCYPCGKN